MKSIADLVGDAIGNMNEDMFKLFEEQTKLSEQTRRYVEAQMTMAESKTKDMTLRKVRIQEQINSVEEDIKFLEHLISGALTSGMNSSAEPESEGKGAIISSPTEELENTGFMEVVISSSEVKKQSDDLSTASANTSRTKAGFWVFSYAREKSESTATSSQLKKDSNVEFDIGFRVKKVTIDRGGWFDPHIFKLSNNYYRLADIRCNNGLNKEKFDQAISSGDPKTTSLKSLVKYSDGKKELECVLPAFPTGFIIVKDIVIRIKADCTQSNHIHEYMESSTTNSGGLFCFGCNTGGSSSRSSDKSFIGNSKNYFYIRIPGPQILGWFLQFTSSDEATKYEELDKDVYASEAINLNQN